MKFSPVTIGTYLGKEYVADYSSDNGIILRSNNQGDLNIGFEYVDGRYKYIKRVKAEEVKDLYRRRYIAKYKGYDCLALDEKDAQILLQGPGKDDRISESIGMKQVDKGVFQKWVNKDEAEIREVREKL